MSAVQSRLPLARPRVRSVRRPFHLTPIGARSPYRLPRDVQDRLASALAPYRNREAAFALAVFIARFWSAPGRIVESFHIDRRALSEGNSSAAEDLNLTEKRIRSAIRTLEEIGFIDRAVTSGSKYKATETGLQRKPVRFLFGSEYFPLFDAANKRAAAARERVSAAGRSQVLVSSHRASTGSVEARENVQSSGRFQPLKGPKSTSEADKTVYLGPLVKKSSIPPQTSEPNPQLEAALDQLLQGIRQSRGG
jgi:hypothetical protein